MPTCLHCILHFGASRQLTFLRVKKPVLRLYWGEMIALFLGQAAFLSYKHLPSFTARPEAGP